MKGGGGFAMAARADQPTVNLGDSPMNPVVFRPGFVELAAELDEFSTELIDTGTSAHGPTETIGHNLPLRVR
jgi:hypothetical protein